MLTNILNTRATLGESEANEPMSESYDLKPLYEHGAWAALTKAPGASLLK